MGKFCQILVKTFEPNKKMYYNKWQIVIMEKR